MATSTQGPVTHLLAALADDGEQADARARLFDLVYLELHSIAERKLIGDPKAWMMRTTSMVHEAYRKLVGGDGHMTPWRNRAHFFGAAGRAMRQVFVERIRKTQAIREGGHETIVPLDDYDPAAPSARAADALADIESLDAALTRLEAFDRRKADVVQLRYFTGLTVAEVAQALDISNDTVNEDWQAARAWLHREITSLKGD